MMDYDFIPSKPDFGELYSKHAEYLQKPKKPQKKQVYVPEVNDYVIWKNEHHQQLEGWVYFKDNAYITIETHVWPKDSIDMINGTFHHNDRTLVVCFPESWKELKYVHSRPAVDSLVEEYYVK